MNFMKPMGCLWTGMTAVILLTCLLFSAGCGKTKIVFPGEGARVQVATNEPVKAVHFTDNIMQIADGEKVPLIVPTKDGGDFFEVRDIGGFIAMPNATYTKLKKRLDYLTDKTGKDKVSVDELSTVKADTTVRAKPETGGEVKEYDLGQFVVMPAHIYKKATVYMRMLETELRSREGELTE